MFNADEFYNERNQHTTPPGTYIDILGSPVGKDEAIEVAILNEHRFAFYYWLKWTNAIKGKSYEIPSLVSIDWHNDLTNLDGLDLDQLDLLDLSNLEKASFFTWARINPLNDTHITSALRLNLIKDVYVLSKQPTFENSKTSEFKDKFGNSHIIKISDNTIDFENSIKGISENSLYFDIDLDYFMTSKDLCGDEGIIMERSIILKILDPKSNLFKLVYEKIRGFTIAREPKWCNGIKNSNTIMDILNENLFGSTLLTKNAKWKIK